MKTMLENFLNGNIADARRQAKRFSARKIAAELQTGGWGFEPQKSWLAANFLKTGDGWQEYCDAA